MTQHDSTMAEAPGHQHLLPPGTFGLPLVGETIRFMRDPDFVKKRQARYGPVFRTHLLGYPTAVLIGPEANRFILSSGMKHLSVAQGWPQTMQRVAEGALVTQDGAEHKRVRAPLQQAFQGQALATYLSIMEQTTLQYLERWATLGSFDWSVQFRQLTFDIASHLFLGTELGRDTSRLSQLYTTLARGGIHIPIAWRWTPYGRSLRARAEILAYLEEVIRQRQVDQRPARDVLGLLVQIRDEQGQALTVAEIAQHAMFLVAAGHETTTSLLTAFSLALTHYPEVWEKLREEQQSLALEGPLTLEQLEQLPWLDQVLKEVQRVYPPFGGGFRKVVETFEFNGYVIPAGWKVYYRIPETHSDPTIYRLPEQFKPERFAPDSGENHKAYSFMTFGGGPRVCLGAAFANIEAKVIFSHLLRSYTWEVQPDKPVQWDHLPTMHPSSGLWVRFKSR
jgi:cytochrome P450